MRMTRLAALLVSLSLPAAAQTETSLDALSKDPERPAEKEEKAAGAARRSKEVLAASGEEVTYGQILQDPDNVELNRRYVRQQVRKGNLRAASTTLERLVMLRPEDASVRLLHGVVLYRLDDAVAAERELEAVLALRDLPDRIRDEARDYLALARKRRKDLHFDARLTIGLGYDDNVNAAPDGDVVVFQDVPLLLDEGSRRKEDANLQGLLSVGGSYDFGGPKGHTGYARLTHFRSEQKVYDPLDIQAYSAEAGAVLRSRLWDVTPSVSFDHVLLSQSTYLRSLNQGLRVERRLTRRWSAFAEFAHAGQVFVDTPLVRAAREREGSQFDYELGAVYAPTTVDRFTAGVQHRRKHARGVVNAYRREGLSLEWLRLLGRGAFMVTTLAGQFDRYEQNDPFVSAEVRHDDAGRLELLAGAPVSLLWRRARDLTLTLGYEHFRQGSNVRNYDYTSNRLSVLLTYQWGI